MFDAELCFTLQTNGTLGQLSWDSGDANSTNVIDLNAAGLDFLNPAKPVFLIVKVLVVFDNLTSLEITLENSAAVGMGSASDIQMWNILAADLDAVGDLAVNQSLPVGTYLRYMRLAFNIVGSNPSSTASIFACLSDSPETAETMPNQVTL